MTSCTVADSTRATVTRVSWLRPADARGHAAAWNASLVYGFAVVSAVIVFAVLYLIPRFG